MPGILCALIKGKVRTKDEPSTQKRKKNANEIFSMIFKLIEMN